MPFNHQMTERKKNRSNIMVQLFEISPLGLFVRFLFTLSIFFTWPSSSSLPQMPNYTGPQTEVISYAQFKDYLSQGRVDNLKIATDAISGTLRAPDGTTKEFTTVRVEDPDLVQELDAKKVTYSGIKKSNMFTTLLSFAVPIFFFLLIWQFAAKRMGAGGGGGVMDLGKSKAKVFASSGPKTTFQDVAGVDEAQQELEEVVEFLKSPSKFQKLGGRIPKGVLLVGPPGTGKTLLARAVAGEANVPFFSISGSEFVEMFVGVGAARVRDLFDQGKKNAPCIIFIDELDALGKARGIRVAVGGNDEREQTLNQLLTEMDGFDSNRGVIIIAATNRPEILDPALLRPGRFDRQILVDRPDINGREAILKIHTRQVILSPEVDLRKIAAMTPGFVGADLANLVNEASLLAARRNKEGVGPEEFDEAMDRATAGLEKKNRVMNPKEKEIVAFHESGHALVAESVEHADPVHKISIIPRGIAALGYTQQQPLEDRYLMTRTELLDRLAVLLGGRVAEELIFQEISTGAQSDLQRATDIARAMITEYGMSDRLGLVSYGRDDRPMFLPDDSSSGKKYGEGRAAEIDNEVARVMEEAHERVQRIILENRGVLERLARLLLEREVVSGEELREMLKDRQNTMPDSPK